MSRLKSILSSVFAGLVAMGSGPVQADVPQCEDIAVILGDDVHSALTAALSNSVVSGGASTNGGFDLEMWGTVVDRDGRVCAVTFTGGDRGDQWPGSRVISAQKAYTANAFSLPGLALSTGNLWAATQPGGSLFGLQFSNPVDTAVGYGDDPGDHKGNDAEDYGTADDPMTGEIPGGINVFGGGLALYASDGTLLGALGVSGDTSCADHNIAWRTRDQLGLDSVPGGVGAPGDNIIFDLVDDAGDNPESPSGFGHPTCSGPGGEPDDAVDNAAIVGDCPLGDGVTSGCV